MIIKTYSILRPSRFVAGKNIDLFYSLEHFSRITNPKMIEVMLLEGRYGPPFEVPRERVSLRATSKLKDVTTLGKWRMVYNRS